MNPQHKHHSVKSVLLVAAVAGALTTGAGIAPSFAADHGVTHAGGGHSHARPPGNARYAARLPHRHGGKRQLAHVSRGGKLTDHHGGLEGIASVYHDRITANGERMNPRAMTAAHKSLPIGTIVTVRNKRNGRSVTVRINDRGPYVAGRVIDLSPGAARIIGLDGLAPVSLTVNAHGDGFGPPSTVTRHCNAGQLASRAAGEGGPGGSGIAFAVPWRETCSSTANGRHDSYLAE